MTNIELVIRIPKEVYDHVLKAKSTPDVLGIDIVNVINAVKNGTSLPEHFITQKQRLCKDCKRWKDSDGIYRRGIEAESKCPINRKEVFEGNGYCYMFEPKIEGESK